MDARAEGAMREDATTRMVDPMWAMHHPCESSQIFPSAQVPRQRPQQHISVITGQDKVSAGHEHFSTIHARNCALRLDLLPNNGKVNGFERQIRRQTERFSAGQQEAVSRRDVYRFGNALHKEPAPTRNHGVTFDPRVAWKPDR